MRRKLAARVAALEKAVAVLSGPAEPPPLWLLTLMAIELGRLLPHEAIAEGYARAIGYADLRSFRQGIAAGEVSGRHRSAVINLLGSDERDPATTLQSLMDGGHGAELERRIGSHLCA